MNKNEVGKHLINDEFPLGIAEVICDISCNGQVCYPNESILVVVFSRDSDAYIADDLIHQGQHWCVCDSIDEFIDAIVYGEQSAREHYCKHYVSDFKKVRPFKGDSFK